MKDGHGGVTIGSEISGGCRNVFVEDSTMDSPNLDRALRFKSNAVRGGVVENIFARNLTVGTVRDAALQIDFLYEEGAKGEHKPVVRNLIIENMTVANAVLVDRRVLGWVDFAAAGPVEDDRGHIARALANGSGPDCVPKPVPCVAYSAVVARTAPDAGLDGSDARVLADAGGD